MSGDGDCFETCQGHPGPVPAAARDTWRDQIVEALDGLWDSTPFGPAWADALVPVLVAAQREAAAGHGPGLCVSVDDANRVLAEEREAHARTLAHASALRAGGETT